MYTLSVKLQHDEHGLVHILLFEIEKFLIIDFAFCLLPFNFSCIMYHSLVLSNSSVCIFTGC